MPIKIANPLPGGQSYTSAKRAEQFIRRGIAIMQDGCLVMLSDNPAIRHRRQQDEYRRAVAAGNCWWNGSDIYGTHVPGEVRS